MYAIVLLLALITGNVHTYGTPNSNQGFYVQLNPTECVGYETGGTPGFFGNALGLNNGDCS